MARPTNFDVESKIVALHGCNRTSSGSDLFVHQDLLCDLLSYFETLIENGTVRNDGHRAVDVPDLGHDACKMLARWLYGQPLCEDDDEPSDDLDYLAELYGFVCDAEEESDTRAKELVDACVDAIRKCLAQTTNVLHDPIGKLEFLLVREDGSPGKAVILRELVYGECATDGRTKLWLEQFCGPGRGYEYRTEIAEMVCMEFAKKGLRAEPEPRWHHLGRHRKLRWRP